MNALDYYVNDSGNNLNLIKEVEFIQIICDTSETKATKIVAKIGDFRLIKDASQLELIKAGLTKKQALKLFTALKVDQFLKPSESVNFLQSSDVSRYIKSRTDLYDTKESFKVLYLNRASQLIDFKVISVGTSTACLVDAKVILKHACLLNSCSIIVSHNHPSGNLNPSKADIMITKKLKEACKLFDISFLDHVITSHKGYYSFAESGLM